MILRRSSGCGGYNAAFLQWGQKKQNECFMGGGIDHPLDWIGVWFLRSSGVETKNKQIKLAAQVSRFRHRNGITSVKLTHMHMSPWSYTFSEVTQGDVMQSDREEKTVPLETDTSAAAWRATEMKTTL